jgi:hypothetical protein
MESLCPVTNICGLPDRPVEGFAAKLLYPQPGQQGNQQQFKGLTADSSLFLLIGDFDTACFLRWLCILMIFS